MRTLKWVVALVALSSACGESSKGALDGAVGDVPDAEVDGSTAPEQPQDGAVEGGPSAPDAAPDAEPDAELPDAAPDAEPDGDVPCADIDGDGAYDFACGGEDCNDADAAVHPNATELCGNTLDDDCNEATLDLLDADGDGFTCVVDCNDDDALEPMTTGACAGVIYATDFEAGPQGWTTSYDPRDGRSESSWALGTPTKLHIDTVASGENAWFTTLDWQYNNHERSYLTSPVIDMSKLDEGEHPVLMFSFVYQMEGGFDLLWVERQVDGGEFEPLGTSGEGFNWYTQTNAWTGFSEGDGVWQTAFHTLEGVAGSREVRFRFAFESDGNVTYEGPGIDDVRVLASLPDVSIQAFDNPPVACEGSGGEVEVGVNVLNHGNEAFSSLTLAYAVNDGAEVVETFAVDLPPGGQTSLIFSDTVGVGEPGQYHVAIHVADERDGFAEDDFTETAATTLPAIRVDDAYLEDFESDDGAWFPFGHNHQWRWGAPDDPNISSAASGERAWYTLRTDVFAYREASFLQSPCFDFSALTADPVLHMRLNYRYGDDTQSNAVLELSTNSGRSWSKLGEQASGSNWYTTDDGWAGPSNTGGEWRTASHRLIGTAGKSATVLRLAMEHALTTNPSTGIDDVRISRSVGDLAVEAARVQAEVGCSSRQSDVVHVDVWNRGNATVNGFELSYAIDHGPAVTEQVAQSIAPGGRYQHEFQLGSDLAALGPHAIEVTASAPGDAIESNDSIVAHAWTQQVVKGVGYVDDFEVDDGSWHPTGVDPAWSWSIPDPSAEVIDRAASGDRAWITGAESGFAVVERSKLTSQCFDLTAFASDPTFRFMHIVDSDSDNMGWFELSVDGGAHFVKVGQHGTGLGWYDSDDDEWLDAALLPEGWHTAEHVLPGTAGQADVMVRFVFDAIIVLGSSRGGHGVDDVSLAP